MSFGAGMGAGMGAGIGTGIAIGAASGQKQAVERIRDYMAVNELTIHDRMGKEVDVDQVLQDAIECNNKGNNNTAAVVIFVGLALLSTLAVLGALYFAFR